MSTPEAAALELRESQARMVRALSAMAALPGFDGERFERAAEALAAKRARAVCRAWPRLTESLGDEFAVTFAAYAAAVPLPRHGGALADGREFAAYLKEHASLHDDAVREMLANDLRFVRRADGLHPRRGLVLRCARLSKPRRLLIGLRLPWIGCRCFSIRLGW